MRQQAGIPVRMYVTDQTGAAVPLTNEQYGHVMGAYNVFQHKVRTSIVQHQTERATLPGGGHVEMLHSYGKNTVRVVVPKAQEVAPVLDYFIYDTFDGEGLLADHVGQIGAQWTIGQGRDGNVTGGYVIGSATYQNLIATASGAIESQEAFVEAVIQHSSPDSLFGFTIYGTSWNFHFYEAIYINRATQNKEAEHRITFSATGGDYIKIVPAEIFGIDFGEMRTIRLDIRSSSVVMSVNNVEKIRRSYPDGSINMTGGGFRMDCYGLTKIHDLKVGRLT